MIEYSSDIVCSHLLNEKETEIVFENKTFDGLVPLLVKKNYLALAKSQNLHYDRVAAVFGEQEFKFNKLNSINNTYPYEHVFKTLLSIMGEGDIHQRSLNELFFKFDISEYESLYADFGNVEFLASRRKSGVLFLNNDFLLVAENSNRCSLRFQIKGFDEENSKLYILNPKHFQRRLLIFDWNDRITEKDKSISGEVLFYLVRAN